MSRQFDRQLKINQEIAKVLEDPQTFVYLAGKIIRRKPKYCPWFAWKAALWLVLTPFAKKPMPIPHA